MFNKISVKTLAGLFVVLLLIVAYLLFFKSGEERSFRKDLVNIDTAKVNEIYIYPKNKKEEIYLKKDASGWKVKIAGDKYVPAQKNKVVNMLNDLMKVKPAGLAARDNSKWHEFQVDSSGTRIKVMENGEPSLDIVIGRFAFQQPNSVSTYVRLSNDVDVYRTDGYLGISFSRSANDFRNSTVIESNKTKWAKLSYRYPSDSSFVLVHQEKRWKIGNTLTDSLKTEQLLNSLGHVTSTDFNDNFTPGQFTQPAYDLVIDLNDTTSIRVNAFIDSSKVILHSSQNPESYFTAKKDLLSRIFLSPQRLLKK